MDDDSPFSMTEIDGLRYTFIINNDKEDASLVYETVNFLVKTGMPEMFLCSVLIRTKTGELHAYLDRHDSTSKRNKLIPLYEHIENVDPEHQTIYFLFLTAGARISWGSFDCLHRAAAAQPDAAIISAVLRLQAGRIRIPKQTHIAFNPWSYIKTFMLLRNSEIVSVDAFFKEAVLIKGRTAVEATQGGLDKINIGSAGYRGHFICVLSAQLV